MGIEVVDVENYFFVFLVASCFTRLVILINHRFSDEAPPGLIDSDDDDDKSTKATRSSQVSAPTPQVSSPHQTITFSRPDTSWS